MSEKIKITVVIDNENTNAHQQRKSLDSVDVTHDPSMTIMSTLLQNDLISGSFCGGRGDCGRCRIRIIEGVMEPTDLEKTVLTPEELKRGYRLACAARPKDDCVITIAAADAPDIAIVTDMIGVTENIDHISQQKNEAINRRSYVTEPASDEAISDTNRDSARIQPETIRETMIAVDLGTTTIAMQLMEADTGRVIDTYCEMNPQRSYGADVLSRIQASCEGNREKLQDLVTEALERGVTRFRQRKAGAPDAEARGKGGAQAADLQDDGAQSSGGQESGRIVCMCIAGNTAMEHLLMGYDVSTLGRSPFVPVETGLQEYRHPGWDFPVWLVPVISAFVGGDIVAGLYACGMLPAGPARSGRAADLLIDLGTNGEMVISDGTRMIATATAAGPAFEGGAGAGMIGSDMIACTAELLRRGVFYGGRRCRPAFRASEKRRHQRTADGEGGGARGDRDPVEKNGRSCDRARVSGGRLRLLSRCGGGFCHRNVPGVYARTRTGGRQHISGGGVPHRKGTVQAADGRRADLWTAAGRERGIGPRVAGTGARRC